MDTIQLISLNGDKILSFTRKNKVEALSRMALYLLNEHSGLGNPNKYRFMFDGDKEILPVIAVLFHQCFVKSRIKVSALIEMLRDNAASPSDFYSSEDTSLHRSVSFNFEDSTGYLCEVTAGENAMGFGNPEVSISTCGQIMNIGIDDVPLLIGTLGKIISYAEPYINYESYRTIRPNLVNENCRLLVDMYDRYHTIHKSHIPAMTLMPKTA